MSETILIKSPNQPRKMQIKQEETATVQESPRIAHTLTACCRCRTRKTRCDPGLPRCGPCERTNSHCEYFDQSKGTKIPRNYVVHLQHKVRDLEKKLAELERDDYDPEPEDMVRHGVRVQIQEHDESKFLGPSSGIGITRLVMQLAKTFTDSSSITDIVDQQQAAKVKEQFQKEEEKPTSKVYPLISDVAAEELPQRSLTNLLVELFNLKVMAMYPFFHEPSFAQDVEDVYSGTDDPFKNYAVRMVIAISLQRMDTQYAGLADSYYLAALKYLEATVKPMNVQTIQACMLMAAYSLLTPTRTAVYYVIGMAVRLAQALGLCEEKTLSQPHHNGKEPNTIEIDMRRRIFWSVVNMDYGLAHSLGRASCFATLQDHIDVKWYETVDDQFITTEGVKTGAPGSLKKWISIHFHKLRLHQLEIRRKLYQKKRDTPQDENDPWFHKMEEKINEWKDASPETDVGTGLNKAWFVGRYNLMIAMMYRPTPQIPRPTLRAAQRCHDAVVSNIYMHKAQIETRNVDMTWIFTQAIFVTINTILWSLSYYEVRVAHPKEDVQSHLNVALYCIEQAKERWPGVSSAIELYDNLIPACMKIYDKDGDIPIAANSPAAAGPDDRSRTTSPVVKTLLPEFSSLMGEAAHSNENIAPFGYLQQRPSFHSASSSNNQGFGDNLGRTSLESGISMSTSSTYPTDFSTTGSYDGHSSFSYEPTFDSSQYDNPLPTSFNRFDWNPKFGSSQGSPPANIPALSPFDQPSNLGMGMDPLAPVQYSDYLYPPSYDHDRSAAGLNYEQHSELMQSLEMTGSGQIQNMISASQQVFYPHGRGY